MNITDRHEKIFEFIRNLHKEHQEERRKSLRLNHRQHRNVSELASYVDAFVRHNYQLDDHENEYITKLRFLYQRIKQKLFKVRQFRLPI